ncbi:MAG: phosphoglucosamine mutase [Holosporaceae bacterium]|jgi:phosphoglucosamine mutase|nr:phosphoglucosamine mutase [Holosporaceae bacterium]
MKKLFGTDGIRGEANKYPLSPEGCAVLACALAKKYCFGTFNQPIIMIGKDTRISGDMLECALAANFSSRGVRVCLMGVVPTPAVSISTKLHRADLGIMVSASHNIFSDNGIKIFKTDGAKLNDQEEEEIELLMEDHSLLSQYVPRTDVGSCSRTRSYLKCYKEKIYKTISIDTAAAKKIKLVVDAANGSLYRLAPRIFRDFQFQIVCLNVAPNGRNINENSGVVNYRIMSEAVRKHGADFGIAFDGDGDRVIMFDSDGYPLDGDYALAILSQAEDSTEIVSTVMSNSAMEQYLQSRHIKLTRTAVGDKYIAEYMQNNPEVKIGGEPSGHTIIRSHALTGDGLFTSLKLLEYAIGSGLSSIDLRRVFRPYPTVSSNIKVMDKSVLHQESVRNTMQSIEKRINCRLIVRPSGTEPLIRIMAEGQDERLLSEAVDQLSQLLKDLGG